MSFLISYVSDQAVSFVIPIKDFAYTLCYYTSNFTVEDIKTCKNPKSLEGFAVGYLVALVPLIIRMIQCFNQARQSSGSFFGHLQMWNFFKYLASVLTVTISFFSAYNEDLFVYFILSSIISTSYSYYWDLVNNLL